MDGLPKHLKAVIEVDLPEWLAEFGERVAAPHVVDQNVEALAPAFDSGDQIFYFCRIGVIHSDSNATAAGGGDEFSGFFDGFRAAGRGVLPCCALSGTAAGAVNGRARFAQCDGNSPAGAAGCSGDE